MVQCYVSCKGYALRHVSIVVICAEYSALVRQHRVRGVICQSRSTTAFRTVVHPTNAFFFFRVLKCKPLFIDLGRRSGYLAFLAETTLLRVFAAAQHSGESLIKHFGLYHSRYYAFLGR